MPPELPILDGAECSHCGCIADSAVIATALWNHCHASGLVICHDCSEECEECGEVFGPRETTAEGTCFDCEERYFSSCEDCGDRTRNSEMERGRCEGCAENYGTCANCGTFCHNDEMTSDDYGEWYCLDCGNPSEDEECAGIHDHGYKPPPEFHHTRTDSTFQVRYSREYTIRRASGQRSRMYLGVEIECESTRGTALSEGVSEIPTGRWYCKADASLSCGFEMVSHPMAWGAWRETDLSFLDSLKGMGFRSYNTETCGMHVHVSRNVLSRLDIYKLLRFCKNAPLFLLRVSRRKKRNLERWARIYEGDHKALILKAKGEAYSYDRYEAVNVTNRNTIEFRLFRGTLDKYAVLRNIAFVQALILFVKETSIKRLSSGVFQQWLRRRGGDLIGRNHAASLLEGFEFMAKEKIEENVCA